MRVQPVSDWACFCPIRPRRTGDRTRSGTCWKSSKTSLCRFRSFIRILGDFRPPCGHLSTSAQENFGTSVLIERTLVLVSSLPRRERRAEAYERMMSGKARLCVVLTKGSRHGAPGRRRVGAPAAWSRPLKPGRLSTTVAIPRDRAGAACRYCARRSWRRREMPPRRDQCWLRATDAALGTVNGW